MININEINQEIDKLENSEYTTLNVCKNLAILYIVREHFGKTKEERVEMGGNPSMMMSSSSGPMPAVR